MGRTPLKNYIKELIYTPVSLLAVIVCLLTSCAMSNRYYVEDNLISINFIDRNGLSETINNPERLDQYSCVDFLQPQPYQKVLRVYGRDSEGNIPAYLTSYHSNGYPHQYLEVINSRASGAYKEWYLNGVQKIEATIIEGAADLTNGAEKTWIFDGCCQAWNENGGLEASILYEKGELEGISTYYHVNGAVWKTIPYHKNKVEGLLEIFREHGSLLQSVSYSNGQKNGESHRYWKESCLAAEEIYCEGLLSFGRYYDKFGASISRIDEGNGVRAIFGKESLTELHEYHDGLLDGEVTVFDKYNRIARLYHIKNGWKHGEEIFFYEAVRLKQKIEPKLSISWYEGKIQGFVKTWYDTGIQESQKEMSNNKRNGHSTAWYRDGSLMLIEEYEQDKLIRGEYYSVGEKFPVSMVDEGKGTATVFDADGNFIRKIDYKNGKPLIDE